MKSFGHCVAAGLAVLLSACVPPSERSYSTQKFELHTDFSEPLCEGDLDRWVSHVDHLEGLLEVDLVLGLDLHVWNETEWVSGAWCLKGSSGCYASARHAIYAVIAAVDHELVHAVAEQWGSRNAFFSEGVATAFEGTSTHFGWSAPSDNISRSSRAVERFTAGHFARWLWETRDHELMFELLASKGDAKAFERIYGLSLTDAQEQYYVEAPWSYPPFFYHEVPLLAAIADDYWQEEVDFDCEQTDVYGRPGGVAVIRQLDIEESGVYVIWTDADGLSISQRQRVVVMDIADAEELASGDVPPDFVAWYAGETLHEVELSAGEYELWVTDFDAELSTATAAVWAHLGPTPAHPEEAE